MLKSTLSGLFGRKRFLTLAAVQGLFGKKRFKEAEAAIEMLHPDTPNLDLQKKCLAAELAFHKSEDSRAELMYREVLSKAPGFPDAHYGLSLLLLEQNSVQAALEHAQFANSSRSAEPRFLAQLGLCYLRQSAYSSAESSLKLATTLNPDDKHSWNNLGIVYRAKGFIADADRCFSVALALDADFLHAKGNLTSLREEVSGMNLAPAGEITDKSINDLREGPSTAASGEDVAFWERVLDLAAQGKGEDALRLGEALFSDASDSEELAVRLASLYEALGDIQGGIDVLRAFNVRSSGTSKSAAKLGSLYAKVHDFNEAIRFLEEAVLVGEHDPDTLAELAHAYQKSERFQDAIATYRRFVSAEANINYLAPYAAALVAACEYDEAIEIFEELLDRDPRQRGQLLPSYTQALQYTGRLAEATENIAEMMGSESGSASIQLMRGAIRLQMEDFGAGWDDYAQRGIGYSKHFRTLPFQKWDGEPLKGKSIVVLAEQGLGDQVMFASCLPDLLIQEPSEVVVECVNRVAPTLARSFPECRVISSNQGNSLAWAADLGSVDYFVPLGDLPRHFRRDRSQFPQAAYLKADPDKTFRWRQRLAERGPRPWIGFSWRGGIEVTRRAVRSMPVENLQSIAQGFTCSWVALQYGQVTSELEEYGDRSPHLHYWPEAISDLDEFAALLSALDGVVTVCNTTVHYAGAIGLPVWVMAPKVPEWRYGLAREDMPWYPAVRVIKQTTLGDWRDVLGCVREALNLTFPDMAPIA